MSRAYQPSLERERPFRRPFRKSGVVVARGARGLLRLCILLLLLVVLLVAVFTGSARIGLPFLSAYKPTLEHRLSEYLQSPVTIDELDARWAGTGPVLRASGVQLTDPSGRTAQFDELLIDLNVPRSLVAGGPVMDELTLVGADLGMAYDQSNGLSIQGFNPEGRIATRRSGTPQINAETSGAKNEGFNAVAWLLTASRVGMLHTRLTLQLPDERMLVVDDLNIRVENDGDLHQVRMDMVLPKELGGAFEVGADIIGKPDKLSGAGGNFYIKAADFKSDGINKLFAAYDVNLALLDVLAERGTEAQLELWGDLADGGVRRVNGRAAIAQTIENPVDDSSDTTELVTKEAAIDSLFGDLSWIRLGDKGEQGWQFDATDVVVGRSGDESVFGEIRLGTSVKNGRKPEWMSLQTADTELRPLINTVESLLPSAFSPNTKAWLEAADPSAKIRSAEVQLLLDSPATSATLNAELDNIQWSAYRKLPGASLGALTLNLVNGRGTISMLPQSVTVSPPELDGVKGTQLLGLAQVAWNAQIDLPQRTVVGGLTVQNNSATLALQHAIEGGDDSLTNASLHVDLQGQFVADSVLDVKPWLTQAWMPVGTRNWLEAAVQGGKVNNGVIRVEGALDELSIKQLAAEAGNPSKVDENTTAQVSFDVQDAKLNYLATWPEASKVNASVVLDKTRLTSKVVSGRVAGMPILKASVAIDNLLVPELELSMASETTLASLVKFGNTGPLKKILNPILNEAKVTGPARLEVAVVTPLRRDPNIKKLASEPWPLDVTGNVFLRDSDIQLAAIDLPLTNVRGPIGFTEDGILLQTVRGKLFGSDVRLNAASTGVGKQRRTDLAVRTVTAGRAILERFNLPFAGFVSGSSNWRADVSVPHDPVRLSRDGIALTLESDLVGTTLDLAEPLGKRSGYNLPLRVSTRFKEDTSVAQVWRLRFGVKENPHSDIRVAVLNNVLEGLEMRLGGSLGDTQPEQGIRVTGATDVISLDGLVENFGDFLDFLPEASEGPEKILPVSVDVRAKHMRTGNSRLGSVSVKANTDEAFINMFIDNDHLRGNVRYPREHWRKDITAQVRVNFVDRVLIDALSSGEPSPEPPKRLDPTTLPPINAHISRFQWDKLVLNNVRIRTEPDAAGLRVRTLGFATGTTQLIGEGLWHLVDAQGVNPTLADQQRAQLHLTLQSSDFGQALGEMGFDRVMANGEGTVTASLNWPDALYAPGIETVAARASLDINRGSLLQIEPGAARLAGIFALQTLPRRLSLDFSDIVSDGLDFASIKGDIGVESGIANTRLVQLNGPIGVVDITGTSDLVAQEFDQQVAVLPRVSAALPIIGIISGGATAGIGAVVAGGVLKALGVDFDRLGLLQYSLTGSWQEPKFTPIRERRVTTVRDR